MLITAYFLHLKIGIDMTSEVVSEKKWQWFPMEFRIALRIFLSLLMFCMIIDRWVTINDKMEIICNPSELNPEYAKEIEIETYLMTPAQLPQLFNNTGNKKFVSWEQKQTGIINDNSPLYFVIRLKNNGKLNCWGKLKAHSDRWCRGSGVEEREIHVQHLASHMDYYQTIVLAAHWSTRGFDMVDHFKEHSPKITAEWLSIYTSEAGGKHE